MRFSEDTALNLVGMVYDAALDQHKWTTFLDAFAHAVGGCSAMLRSADLQAGKAGFVASVGYDPAWQAAYCKHYVKLDYLTPTLNQFKLGEAKSNDQIFSLSEQRKTEMYNDYFIPQDKVHAMGSLLVKDGNHTLLFAAQRGKRAGAFGEEQARLMGILAPHVTRAVQVHHKISSLTVEKEWALGALDQLRMGVILTNSTGTPLFVNRAAEQLLALGQGINTRQGQLALPKAPETARFYQLITDAAQGAPGTNRGGDMRITLPGGEFLHCMVMPIPLALSARLDVALASGCVAIFLSKQDSLQLPPQRLAALYGLTPAEARLASKLAALRSVEQAADELCISVHTARSQLKSIFAKTGSKSQSELLMLLATRAATLTDMQQLVSNFSVAQWGGINTVAIRGVGGGGRNIGFDTRVGVYVDGIYMGQSQALDQSLFDIEQVEVLRGPQGHLFGRNSVAGAVNITTRAPSETFESSFRATAGNYNTREGYANVSGPMTDKLSGQIFLGYEARDGFTTNLFNHQKLDDLKRASTRGQLAIQATDRLEINLSADYADIRQKQVLGEAMTDMGGAPLAFGPYAHHTVNFNTTPYINNTLSGGSLTASYDMAGGNTLTAITGYRSTHQNRQNDTDYTPNDVLHIDYTDDFKQFSQEIRIASAIKGPLRYVAGMYLMHESADTYRIAVVGANGAMIGVAPGVTVPISGAVKTDSYALFGSLDYDLASRLTLNLGARYTDEKKNLLYNLTGAGILGMGTAVNYTDTRSDAMLTPTLGVTYALNNSLNIYGKYSSGFKSGGWNLDYLTNAQIANNISFNRETVDSYELGLKGYAPDHRMSYDLSIFHSSFKNFQIFQFVNTGITSELQLRNAAQAESIGAEASLRALVTDNLSIGGNIGTMKAKFNSFPGGMTGGGDAAGKRLPDAPDLTVAVTANYSMSAPSLGGRLNFYGERSYRSKSYSGVDNNEALDSVGSRDIVNARVSLVADHTRLGLSLWARNLFDSRYTTAHSHDFFGNQFIKRGDPRAFGIEGKFSF